MVEEPNAAECHDHMILVASHNNMVIPNRKDAVRYAIENAEDGDFITILGLGHESYQEENGVKYPYSDREYVLQVVKELGLQSSEQ